MLFTADTASHIWNLRLSIVYEDLEKGRKSLQRLAGLNFNTAVFGHGNPIKENAADQFQNSFL